MIVLIRLRVFGICCSAVMARRMTARSLLSTHSVLLLALMVCLVGGGEASAMSKPPGKGNERLSNVLQDAAQDTVQIITKSQTPVRDLLVKHKHSLQMFASGSLAGWLGFKVFKFITVGIIKTTVFSLLALACLAWGGGIGGSTLDAITQKFGGLDTRRGERALRKALDINRDGTVDVLDVKEYFARLERLLLQSNLPLSFGVMFGVAFGFLFI